MQVFLHVFLSPARGGFGVLPSWGRNWQLILGGFVYEIVFNLV